ncbi:MAG: peroxiredoxin [Pseudomonadales bacterium]
MLNIGSQAPDFVLPDQHGNTISLAQTLQQGPVVVYFYPADFTPVCTAEACAFRDANDDLEAVDIKILGISPQSVDSHRRFADRYSLPFSLLFDEGKQTIKAFGVDGPLGFGVRRATFLINTEQQIANRVVADLFVGSHMDFIKQVLNNESGAA